MDDNDYYLADLIGLAAVDGVDRHVGVVSAVHDYGAGASLEIAGSGAPLLIPFTAACVPVVDIAAGCVVVAIPDEIVISPEAEEAA